MQYLLEKKWAGLLWRCFRKMETMGRRRSSVHKQDGWKEYRPAWVTLLIPCGVWWSIARGYIDEALVCGGTVMAMLPVAVTVQAAGVSVECQRDGRQDRGYLRTIEDKTQRRKPRQRRSMR